ncbi:AMID-like protein [Mya arenaria]|uniref:AMID-like protein n=1 Tax=Mya arenaria TaxID=6604 RepID=A0ABY7FX97_MYAAR|nr:AMID-like protein [Mya arenaria]
MIIPHQIIHHQIMVKVVGIAMMEVLVELQETGDHNLNQTRHSLTEETMVAQMTEGRFAMTTEGRAVMMIGGQGEKAAPLPDIMNEDLAVTDDLIEEITRDLVTMTTMYLEREYTEVMTTDGAGHIMESLKLYNDIEGLVPPTLPVKYPRTPGYRPEPSENSCNAWFNGSSFTNDTGPTLNPKDQERSAGGSSGGSAAVVKNGEADVAIGGDQGGSIRIPSSWVGIVGLKPTWGLVPYTGVVPIETTVDHAGPMAANVTDCALLLEAIAGYDDGRDPRQESAMTCPPYSKQNYGAHYYARAQNLNWKLTKTYDELLEKYDVIIMPTLPYKAPLLPKTTWSLQDRMKNALGMVKNTAPFDITGHPALTINAGMSEGLPIGLQIVGKRFDDVKVLQFARAFEKLQ